MQHSASSDDDVRPWRGDGRGVLRPEGGRIAWEESVDLLVAGCGGAGAAAALEARAAGATVMIVDRFTGGGATKMSGGVVYLGGGTALQQAAGYHDTPEEMFKYLTQEVNGAVSDETLRAFCAAGVETLQWLQSHGIPFPAAGRAFKTSYPPDECTLYFSGNEICPPYSEAAVPAPRGHRAFGKGLTGHVVFAGLDRSLRRSGADVRLHTKIERLVVDDRGDVLGALVRAVPPVWRPLHRWLYRAATWGGAVSRALCQFFRRRIDRLEARYGRAYAVRARGGVVLSTGGYVYNPPLMDAWTPDYARCSMRLGTAGDAGTGIRLGRGAGGKLDKLDRACAWVFINPPSAWTAGILVGPDGSRICNEEYYGSTIGVHMTERHGGKGVLILDAEAIARSRRQLLREDMGWFQQMFGVINIYLNRAKAPTLAALARKCGIPAAALSATVAEYNAGAAAGRDRLGKSAKALRPLVRAPFYAIRCDTDNMRFPIPCITLGGLVVDGVTQRVVRDDGTIIRGLYAAGRTAVGVSSHSYVSGLSVADAVFSGRNAARHAAVRARGQQRAGAAA